MKPNRTVAFAMGAITALVLGSGTAYAATGGKFIIGKSNSATSTSTLSNSRGTALALNSKSGTAPLKVNSATKVAKLNADKLDGRDSTSFALASGQVGSIGGVGQYLDVNNDNVPDFLVSVATCPTGTKLTGGGGEDDSGGVPFVSEAIDSSDWLIVSTTTPDPTTSPDPSDLLHADAQCWNPKGAVSGAMFRTTASRVDLTKHTAVVQRLEGALAARSN